MKNFILFVFLAASISSCMTASKPEEKPNIIYFLADDLGYGETGAYGQQKIQTPNIDALAKNGMRFTSHYSGSPVCAPSRYVLLTGKHTGHAYIRGNDEWKERGDVWNYEKASADPSLEGQRPIPNNTITIGKKLKEAGYTTAILGKWGLGAPGSEGVPNNQGFDYFYGYNCQRQAHNLYPPHLWENSLKDYLDNELVSPGTKLDSLADIFDEESYEAFTQKDFAPEIIHEKALTFIKEHAEKPFFMLYASPLPHLPLQAPQDKVAEYQDLLEEEGPYTGHQGYFPNKYPRATYAAMISYLDQQVGELIASLKEEGIYDNTIILFSSDNGPTYCCGVDYDYFESSKPFSNGYGRTKGFVYEGGIRVPLIASWKDHIEEGSVSEHISAFYDLMPTVCDLAAVDPVEESDGISFKATLLGEEQEKHDFLYWEFPSYNGQQAVRLGKWKGIRKDIFKGNLAIELYDLETDPAEQVNLAEQNPEMVKEIEGIMLSEHVPAEVKRFSFKELGD